MVNYNRAINNPVKKCHHLRYVKIDKVSLGFLSPSYSTIIQNTKDVVDDNNIDILNKLLG